MDFNQWSDDELDLRKVERIADAQWVKQFAVSFQGRSSLRSAGAAAHIVVVFDTRDEAEDWAKRRLLDGNSIIGITEIDTLPGVDGRKHEFSVGDIVTTTNGDSFDRIVATPSNGPGWPVLESHGGARDPRRIRLAHPSELPMVQQEIPGMLVNPDDSTG